MNRCEDPGHGLPVGVNIDALPDCDGRLSLDDALTGHFMLEPSDGALLADYEMREGLDYWGGAPRAPKVI